MKISEALGNFHYDLVWNSLLPMLILFYPFAYMHKRKELDLYNANNSTEIATRTWYISHIYLYLYLFIYIRIYIWIYICIYESYMWDIFWEFQSDLHSTSAIAERCTVLQDITNFQLYILNHKIPIKLYSDIFLLSYKKSALVLVMSLC